VLAAVIGRAAGVLAALLSLTGCVTSGTAVIVYPDKTQATINFKKGLLDDLDIPAADPLTGRPSAYIRVGTSRVAAQTALEGYKLTGEALRRYITEKAAENANPQR
jgi:hypothetical protein